MLFRSGMQATFGPLIGALAFLLLEEGLSRLTEYSNLILGPLLLIVAVSIQGGIDGLISGRRGG